MKQTKTRFISFILASLACASVAQARWYVGIDAGYTGARIDPRDVTKSGFYVPKSDTLKYTFKNYIESSGGGKTTIEPFMGYNIGVNFGSEHFFANNYVGIRWGAGIGYTSLYQKTTIESLEGNDVFKTDASFLDTGVNLDLMVNFWSNGANSVGIFGGVEANYHYALTSSSKTAGVPKEDNLKGVSSISRSSFDLSGRVGLSALIANHHRIDLTAKLPIGYVETIDENNPKNDFGNQLVKTSFNLGYKFIF